MLLPKLSKINGPVEQVTHKKGIAQLVIGQDGMSGPQYQEAFCIIPFCILLNWGVYISKQKVYMFK